MRTVRAASDTGKNQAAANNEAEATEAKPASPPETAATKQMARLMKGGKHKTDETKIPVDSSGALNAMFSQMVGGLVAEPGQNQLQQAVNFSTLASGVSTSTSINQERCAELVDRILVSKPVADGMVEVRIKVDKPWLPETDIRLTLAQGVRLEVEFETNQSEAQRFLLPNLSSLRERLTERTGMPTVVRMSEGGEGGSHDGRSRNRRTIIEEKSED